MKKFILILFALIGGVTQMWADNQLKGSWNNWATASDIVYTGSIGSVTIGGLEANATYEFGLQDGSDFYKNSGTMTKDNCANWELSTSAVSNIKIKTTIAGDYTFKVVWIGGKPRLWVVYPDQGNYVIHFKNYDGWSKVAYHSWLIDIDGVKANEWPGTGVTTTNTNNPSYYDLTLTDNFYNGIIFNNDNATDPIKQTGDLNIYFNSSREFWVTDANTITYDAAPEDWVDYQRNVTSGNFGTICLPYAATLTGATAYKIVSTVGSGDDMTAINLESVETLEAGKAYIYKASADKLKARYTNRTTSADATADYGMMGNLSDTPVTLDGNTTAYVIKGNKICKVVTGGSGVNVGKNKGYITLDGISAVAAPSMDFIPFEDAEYSTTGISNAVKDAEAEGAIYNLNGQRVTSAQKGLFIINGKKVIR